MDNLCLEQVLYYTHQRCHPCKMPHVQSSKDLETTLPAKKRTVCAHQTFISKHFSSIYNKTRAFNYCSRLSGVPNRLYLLCPYFLQCLSVRDADGDVDTCPMWTFPTVRPTSMNKLQKGYTHTDSEVRHTHTYIHIHNTAHTKSSLSFIRPYLITCLFFPSLSSQEIL